MKRFDVQWVDDKKVKISGTIDENFTFDDEVAKFNDEVEIDLRGVERINSCGVREWIKAILKTNARIHFVNCSSVIVAQFSMIPEFLGNNGVVDSFETQFVCDHCGHEESKILVVGKDIQPGQEIYEEGPELACSECGEMMECDHNPELYFSFLSEVG
jgi:DNA-directed RNA polymerase subunit RPC12/RpoP